MPQHTILRFPTVKSETGQSRTTVHRRIHDGTFPRPVSLGGRAVGWPAAEIAALNAARIAGKSDEEIRELVSALHAARNSGQSHTEVTAPVKAVAPAPRLRATKKAVA